jgi:hypothetical protein
MPPRSRLSKKFERHYVQHNYHDHSQDIPSSNRDGISNLDSRNGRSISLVKFPMKLHELLENSDMYGISHIISWKVHGRAFAVNNVKEFVDRVMPCHFNQSKITSFFRQLNLYGFLRITQGRDQGAYYHELFVRGKPFLATRMRRQKVKGTKIKGLPSPATEPDFYSMPFVMVIPSPPTMTDLALPNVIHDDLLPKQYAVFPKITASSLHTYASKEAKVIDYSPQFKVCSSDDGANLSEEGRNFHRDQGDVDAVFSACENSDADISFSNVVDLCTLLLEPEEPFNSSLNVTTKVDDYYPEIEDGLLDDVVHYFSFQECQVLRSLLEDHSVGGDR